MEDYELNKDTATLIRKVSLLTHNKMSETFKKADEIEAKMRKATSDEEKTTLLETMCEYSGYCHALLEVEQFLADELTAKMLGRQDESKE